MIILKCQKCGHDGEMNYDHYGAGLTCSKCGGKVDEINVEEMLDCEPLCAESHYYGEPK